MISAQSWLDTNYPLNKRSQVYSLNIRDKFLKGSLKLERFINLKVINCSFNELTELQITDSSELEEIRCQNNQLKKLKFQGFPKTIICNDNNLTGLELGENKKLEKLDVMDNNFSSQDLSFLKPLVNLRNLRLGNWDSKKINSGLYNRFYGSLEFLKSMNKLERLDIRNTDISSGLEYLPDSVVYFSCLADFRKGARVSEIYTKLDRQKKIELMDEEKDIANSGFIKDFPDRLKVFKENSKEKEDEKQTIKRLEKQIEQLKKENKTVKKQKDELQQKVNDLSKKTDELEELVENKLGSDIDTIIQQNKVTK